jgi:hypothetical protein
MSSVHELDLLVKYLYTKHADRAGEWISCVIEFGVFMLQLQQTNQLVPAW